MIDFIQGQRFVEIADYTYSPKVKQGDDYDNLPNTLDIDKLEDYDIIYTHTMYAKQLFNEIEMVDKKLIIVTHNSDMNVDDSFMLPDNVIKWYTQNVNTINPRIESIPIGLENDRWFPEVKKKEKMLAKLKEPRNYRNLVYMNFNIANAPAKRQPVYDYFKDKPWVTVQMGKNGIDFDEYLDNIYNHKFVLCPEGNGIDTHRIWETLYMGNIPIVLDSINNNFYRNLSIIPTLSWEGINERFLENTYNSIYLNDWDSRDILTFDYWKHKITGK